MRLHSRLQVPEVEIAFNFMEEPKRELSKDLELANPQAVCISSEKPPLSTEAGAVTLRSHPRAQGQGQQLEEPPMPETRAQPGGQRWIGGCGGGPRESSHVEGQEW